MFSADLSWTDPDTEKVGERRQRIAQEKALSVSSAAPSLKSSRSSKSSVVDDRELWWPSSLKKARGQKSSHKTRSSTSHGSDHARKASSVLPTALDAANGNEMKDPLLQPAWTYSTSLSSTLPSGASLEPSEHEVPELEGDISSRGTNSIGSRSSRKFDAPTLGFQPQAYELTDDEDERQLGWKSPSTPNGTNKPRPTKDAGFRPFTPRTAKRSIDNTAFENVRRHSGVTDEHKMGRRYPVKLEGCLGMDGLHLQDQPEMLDSPTETKKPPPYDSAPSEPYFADWKPPTARPITLPNLERPLEESVSPPYPLDHKTIMADYDKIELTRFQRFIRRMASAGPKVVLDRLKEQWHDAGDDEANEELTLEKQLWFLTAFQLQNLGRYSRFPKANTGRILELYGNLSEVYQLSAMHPRQNVHYLTTRPQKHAPLPGNVTCFLAPTPGLLPFPYPDASFSHIRASTLPSLVPSSKLPEMFHECYRLLAPGGMLEIRIMDAGPVHTTAGPKMKAWMEDRLAVNLERLFRCSKPCKLVPGWVADAGFDLPKSPFAGGEQTMMLPCAFHKASIDVESELSTLVGRELWKDIWGGFVNDEPGEPRWWWEDDDVVQECLERETVFECGAIFAFKGLR